MRVLAISNMLSTQRQPHRVFVDRQIEALRAAGDHVDVIHIDGDASHWQYLRALIDVLRLNVAPRRYDLVHAHMGHCGLVAAFQVRYPVVLTYYGYDLDGDWPGHAFEQRLFRALSAVFAATIAQSRRGREALPRAGRRRCEVVASGVDRAHFVPRDRVAARRELGWDEDAPIALFAARPDRWVKHFDLAEAAVAEVGSTLPGIELKVASSVQPDDMPVWFAAADVLLLTSRTEGSPNIVKEAMACNLPIVSTDVGDVADVVAGTEHCHVCADTPAALATALVEVLHAGHVRTDGRERTEHLAAEAVAARVQEVYRAAIKRGPGIFGFKAS